MMILASHFTGQIEQRLSLGMVLMFAAFVGAGLSLWVIRPGTVRVGFAVLMVVPLGLGGNQLLEVVAAHHNHVCHAHNLNTCSGDSAHDEDGHSHSRGGWAAAKEDEGGATPSSGDSSAVLPSGEAPPYEGH